MKNNTKKIVAIVLMAGAILPALAQAAIPAIMLEKSASYALRDTVRAFSVPTTDSTGKVRYFDVIIDLNVNAGGIISSTANVLATPSPVITTKVIVPGNYKVTGSTDTCKVNNITLTNGRVQSFFKCTRGTAVNELSVANGTISAGHPYFAELTAKKANLYSDVATQTWGLTNGITFAIGSCSYYYASYAVGAKTDGSQIVLSTYSRGVAPYTYTCGNTLVRVP
ncbi:hypothetical protein [Methyloglobulus sp.]|uniref:hypothetical protein n=1 Tax=Methyloglobulus sp. TaxID=2518622 RepID=UPI0032B7E505